MSGIAGVIRFDGAPADEGIVARMTASMAYRGPDGIRCWTRGSVSVGHCLLRTTEESVDEMQPVVAEGERVVLVFDGWLSEPAALRAELVARGATLRNRSDSELVLRAYEVWGPELVRRLEGDFALVIWDATRREALCARDPIGHRPFHYAWDGSALVFATDIHAVFEAPWVRRVANDGMVAEYLAGEWYTVDETLWADVLKLRAAHTMRVSANGVRTAPYWTPPLDAPLACKTDGEFEEAYRALIRDCVRRASRSHRTVAIDVSGGLDSSAVFCVAEELRRAGRLPAPGIAGFTLGFDDGSEACELPYARAVAAHTGTRLTEVEPTVLSLADYEARARRFSDFPGFGNATMSLGLRRRGAAAGHRVTLSGEGGDGWLRGTRVYYAEELAQGNVRSLVDCFRADASAYGAGTAGWWLVHDGNAPLVSPIVREAARSVVRRLRGYRPPEPYWLSEQLRRHLDERRDRSVSLHQAKPTREGQRALLEFLDDGFSTLAMDAWERDAATEGIESRHPLRDRRFIEFAFRTPERLRSRGDSSKVLHVRAMGQTLPAMVHERRTKAEFSVVIRRQLEGLDPGFLRRVAHGRGDWLIEAGVEALLETMRSNPRMGWPLWPLWGIVACDRLLPGAPPESGR